MAVLEPITRMIVREVALGLTSEEIALNHPEYTEQQINKMRAGTTFMKAVQEMLHEIDLEVIEHAGEDPVRKYLRSKGLCAARTLVDIADCVEASESARVNAANSILDRGGYGKKVEEQAAIPVIMLSPEKLNAVLAAKGPLATIPDCVDNELLGNGE